MSTLPNPNPNPNNVSQSAGLPFPGELTSDGNIDVVHRDIYSMKAADLQKLCRYFALRPRTNRKEEYLKSLVGFSGDNNAWTAFRQGVKRRRHKGPRESTAGSGAASPRKAKLSTRRREALVRTNTLTIGGSGHARVPLGRNLLDWANDVMSLKPGPLLECAIIHPPSSAPIPISRIVSDVVDVIQSQGGVVQVQSVPIPTITSAPSAPALAPAPLNPNLVLSSSTHNLVPLIPAPQGIIKARVLVLGDGQELHYNANDVPDPPAIHVTADVTKLACIWDDSSAQWDSSSPLVIKGIPIALKHWRNVYSHHRKGSKIWTGIKQTWHSWKYIMTEYRNMGTEDFWAKWSKDGVRYCASKILAGLQEERRRQDKEIADQARAEYDGGSFEREFAYRKASKFGTCSKNSAIASRYRLMKGL